jgi:AcrR family transcriptional regulator
MTAEGTEVRRPGRPRDERADRAIVTAALEMLVEEGYHALSVEAVAARAGVGKTTVYRRWAGKRELVVDALAELNTGMPDLPAPGPTRERVLQMMEHVCSKDLSSMSSRIMPRMIAYRSSHPELYADYLTRVIRPRRERLKTVLREGIDRGDVRPDLDVELAALSLTAPLIMFAMTAHEDRPLRSQDAQTLLDIVWPGVAASVS